MSPQEKAKALIDKFDALDSKDSNPTTFYNDSKQCALVAVDEMFKELSENPGPFLTIRVGYWQQVKQEIERYEFI